MFGATGVRNVRTDGLGSHRGVALTGDDSHNYLTYLSRRVFRCNDAKGPNIVAAVEQG